MNICIYGASSNQPGKVYFQDAETLGRLIAEAGHTLVFGGGRDGLMGACARGAAGWSGSRRRCFWTRAFCWTAAAR